MVKAYRREIFALLFALVFIPIAFSAGTMVKAGEAESHPVDGFTQAEPCPGTKGESSTCWIEYYEAFLANYTSIDALQDLKSRYYAGEGAATFCHPLLHIIGAKASVEFGSVAAAYEHGETFCRAGYYHGVLEGLFGEDGGEQLLSRLDSICSNIPGKERHSYDYFSCVHGIGHGVMAFFDHDLFESLAACDQLDGAWERTSCHGGVFMENVTGNAPENPSKFLKEDDLLYPCNAVPEEYRQQCYLMQTSHMLTVLDGDFATVFAACREAGTYANTCFQSLGRDVSGYSYGSPTAVRAFCGVGATLEERGFCLLGAASDYVQSYGEDAARSLCVYGEDGTRTQCVAMVEWQLAQL